MQIVPNFELLLIVHAAATWAMVGVILIVQIVHYPLFASVGTAAFQNYEAQHTRRITWVVAPLMLLELAAAISLLVFRPSALPSGLMWTGIALLAVIWASTALLQVPLHRKLANGFDPELYARLLATNWARTGAWLSRGLVAAALLVQHGQLAVH